MQPYPGCNVEAQPQASHNTCTTSAAYQETTMQCCVYGAGGHMPTHMMASTKIEDEAEDKRHWPQAGSSSS